MGAIEDQGRNEVAWRDFLRGHGGDVEDALLEAAAAFERENPPKAELTRPTWSQVRQASMTTGTAIEYITELDPTTEMRYLKAVSEDGTKIEGFVPVTLPDEGVKVKVNGVPGILYLHPDGEVHLDETEPADEADAEAEQERLMAMSKIEGKLVSYNPLAQRQLYGISISDEFALSLIEAWQHIGHGGDCQEVAETYLTRFIEQMVNTLHTGNATKEES